VPLRTQDCYLHQRFPTFSYYCDRKKNGVWHGTLQPRNLAPLYRVEIRYRLGTVPKVRVLSPTLVPGSPHIYPDDGSLCLYWPAEWRWTGDQLLAETIVPWTADWLCFYELWLDCGEWLGPASPHSTGPKQAETPHAA
jgi:hypothetical protein